jgi:hypothetical protein
VAKIAYSSIKTLICDCLNDNEIHLNTANMLNYVMMKK